MYKLQTKYGWEWHTITSKQWRRDIEDALDIYLSQTAEHGEILRIVHNGKTIQTIHV
jgi:hypothetical protein